MQEFVFRDTISFVAALARLSCDGKWFLPKWTEEYSLSADAYIVLREQWESAGIAILDFDGELHPTRNFARVSYNMIKARSALCYMSEEVEQIFLLGPVDVLSVQKKKNIWTLRLCRPTEVNCYIRQELFTVTEGVLRVQSVGKAEMMQRSEKLVGSEGQAAVLDEFLDLFFGRSVKKDA